MIGRLTGVLIEKQQPKFILDVQGVGYEVECPLSTFYRLPELGQTVMVLTQFIVREDSQVLFGFLTRAEQSLFRHLVKVNGVGPRLALTILSGVTPVHFQALIQTGDTSALMRIPGVGKKTAERLLIEMRDRLADAPIESSDVVGFTATFSSPEGEIVREALSALISLGYKPPEAGRMVQAIEDKSGLNSGELVRRVLQAAARNPTI